MARTTGGALKTKVRTKRAAGPQPTPTPPPPIPTATTVTITDPAGAHPAVPPNFSADGTVSPLNFSVVGWVFNPNNPNPVPTPGVTAPQAGNGTWQIDFANVPAGNNQALHVETVETPVGVAQKPIDVGSGMMPMTFRATRDTIQITHPRHGADLSAGFIARGTVADASQRVYGVIIRPGKPPVVTPGRVTQNGRTWKVAFQKVPRGNGLLLRIHSTAGGGHAEIAINVS
jgi:hypothetical protein